MLLKCAISLAPDVQAEMLKSRRPDVFLHRSAVVDQHQNHCTLSELVTKRAQCSLRIITSPWKLIGRKTLCDLSLPVPSLCRVQLMKSASDVYPQMSDSKLQEPGNSWLCAWMMPLNTEGEKERRTLATGNGKYESWQLALTETCPHSPALAPLLKRTYQQKPRGRMEALLLSVERTWASEEVRKAKVVPASNVVKVEAATKLCF